LREALAAQEVEEDLRVTPPHIVGVALALGRPITEIAPAIDHLLGRAPADAELQAPAGDEIGGTRVLGHVERVLVAHVDDRRSDLDAAGLRADGRQQGERRGKLSREVMNAKIGSVHAQFLSCNRKLNGLRERIRSRAGLRLRRGRPMPEGEESDLLSCGQSIDVRGGLRLPVCRMVESAYHPLESA
jgi:hypothetical protein